MGEATHLLQTKSCAVVVSWDVETGVAHRITKGDHTGLWRNGPFRIILGVEATRPVPALDVADGDGHDPVSVGISFPYRVNRISSGSSGDEVVEVRFALYVGSVEGLVTCTSEVSTDLVTDEGVVCVVSSEVHRACPHEHTLWLG